MTDQLTNLETSFGYFSPECSWAVFMGCLKNYLTKLLKIWDLLDYKVKLSRTATWDSEPIKPSCRSLISISTLYGNSPTYFLYSARALSQFIYALTWCLGFGVQVLLQEAPEWKGLDVFKRTNDFLILKRRAVSHENCLHVEIEIVPAVSSIARKCFVFLNSPPADVHVKHEIWNTPRLNGMHLIRQFPFVENAHVSIFARQCATNPLFIFCKQNKILLQNFLLEMSTFIYIWCERSLCIV